MLEKYAEVMLLICLNGKQMGTAWLCLCCIFPLTPLYHKSNKSKQKCMLVPHFTNIQSHVYFSHFYCTIE